MASEHPDSEGKLAPDRVIGELAAAQSGVVARRQLVARGVATSAIERRLANGRLVPLHRGVYAVGHRHLRREGRWLAAVLAVPGSVLSHRDAAGLHGIRPANHARVDVTGRRAARHEGIAVHGDRLDARDVAEVQGIPVTTVARTLVDLAGTIPHDHLARALRRAEELRVLDRGDLRDALARVRTRRGPGHRAMREALAEYEAMGATFTRSSLEDAFLRVVERAGLPRPRTNVLVEGMEVDAVWRAARVIVELDGWEFHRSRHAFDRDRARDAGLTAAGWRVVRFTHGQVTRRPGHVVEVLRRLGLR